MYRSLSKKYKFFIIFTIIIACIASAILSMRWIKADERASELADNIDMADGDNASGGKTNIDHIIDFVNAGDDPDTVDFLDDYYYIVEIGSGSPSTLADFIVDLDGENNPISGKFYDLVIDGNKTTNQTQSMPAGRIRYQFFNPASMSGFDSNGKANLDNAVKALANADLVYISYDAQSPFKVAGGVDNDIPEIIKTQLDSLATGDYKPVIIDNPYINNYIKDDAISTFTTLIDSFKGLSKRAYAWDLTNPNITTARDFFNKKQGSKFNSYKANSSVWTPVYKNDPETDVVAKDPDTDEELSIYEPLTKEVGGIVKASNVAKILTITADSSDMVITNKILSNSTKENISLQDEVKLVKFEDETIAEKVTKVKTKESYVVDSASDVYMIYSARSPHPEYIDNDILVYDAASDDNTLASYDLTQYDLIIIEGSCSSKPLKNVSDQDDYSILYGAMNGGMMIIYDDSIGSGNSNTYGASAIDAPNFGYIYGKLTTASQDGSTMKYTASSKDKSKYSHVLLTNKKKFDTYTSATFAVAEKDIVDIINNGTFRGLGNGGSDVSNKYNVLEIQPCYPIDTSLEPLLQKYRAGDNYGFHVSQFTLNDDYGFYYMLTDAVLNNVTPDEITYDGEHSLSETESIYGPNNLAALVAADDGSIVSKINYYNWELSPAKILHVLKQTNPTMGFTDYSLNQINVVHMSMNEFISNRNSLLENYDMIYIGGNISAIKPDSEFKGNSATDQQLKFQELKSFTNGTYYKMFYHNGEYVKFTSTKGSQQEYYNKLGITTGNDLTAVRLAQLQEYVSTGMPIVISSDVVNAYENVANGNQHLIDPQTNMYSFLDSLNTAKENSSNIVWNFNPHDTIIIGNDGEYGNTVSGSVTVFKGVDTKDIYDNDYDLYADNGANYIANAISKSNYRPKFYLAKAPMPYSEYDSSTWLSSKKLIFDVEVTSNINPDVSNTASVYLDLNGNSRFEEPDERFLNLPISASGKITLNLPLQDDFYGGVYWKVEVRTGSSRSATTGVCKIKKLDTDPKTIVNLLQIMPTSTKDFNDSYNTLYFCTECQRFRHIFDTNISYSRHEKKLSSENILMSKHDGVTEDITGTFFGLNAPDLKGLPEAYTKYTLGLHQHNFGIVKFGTNTDKSEWDDWDSNWADGLINEYDFNLNIMDVDEFDAKISEIRNVYKNLSDEEATENQKRFSGDAELFYNYYLCIKYLIEGNINVAIDSSGTLILTQGFGQVDNDKFSSFVSYMKESLGVSSDKLFEYSKVQDNIDKEIDKNIDSAKTSGKVGVNNADADVLVNILKYIKTYHRYHDFYNFFNAGDDAYKSENYAAYDYSKVYGPWRDAKIYEKYFYDNWLHNKELSCYNEEGKVDFSGLYDTIIIGAGESSSLSSPITSKDLSIQGCEALITYDAGDGHLFLLHDALTYDTPNMTSYLRELFGQDARHMKVSKAGGSFNPKSNDLTIKVGDNTVNYSIPFEDYRTDLTFRQSSKAYTEVRNINVDVEGTSKSVPISPTDKTLNVNVKRTAKGGMKTATLKWEGNDWNQHTFNIDTSRAKAIIHIKHNNSGYYGGIDWGSCSVSYENTSSGSGFEIELISELINGTWQNHVNSTYFTVNIDGKEYNVKMNSFKGAFTIPKDYEYNITSSNSGTVSGNSDQNIIVNVVDESNAAINGVDVTVDNEVKSTVNGRANFTTKNYSDDYYDLVVKSVNSHVDTASDDVSIKVKTVTSEVGYNPISDVPVTIVNHTSGKTYEGYTDINGEFTAANDISNYNPITGGSYIPQYIYTGSYANGGENEALRNRYSISSLSRDGSVNFDFTATAITPRMSMVDGNDGNTMTRGIFMTKYSKYSHEPESVQCQDGQFNHATHAQGGHMCTDRATQNNIGLVTKYPFTIGDTLNISGTHPQAYSVDIEDEDMTVWYSLAGGINGSVSQFLAANPNDGQNNYFIYSYGNVTYCGVGHTSVTGHNAYNNDERRLLINVIVNNSRRAAVGSAFELGDVDSEEYPLSHNTVIDKGDGTYQITVNGETEYPNFAYYASVDVKSGSSIKRIHAYYDLDLSDGEDVHDYKDDTNHILFYDTNRADRDENFNNVVKYVDGTKTDNPYLIYDKFKFNQNYLRDHNGVKYTYIVVCLTTVDKTGKESYIYRKIKLVPNPVLYDLN